MGPSRKRKTTVRVSPRRYPFIVQILVPEEGFGLRLDAINAWHRYTNNRQRRTRPHQIGQQKFSRWCFENMQAAEKFRERFGGEIVFVVAESSEGSMAGASRRPTNLCGTSDQGIPDRV